MRKRNMTITVLGFIGVFLIAVFALIPTVHAGEKTFKYKVVSHTTKVKVNSGQDLRLAQADILDDLPEEGATGKTTGTVEDTIDEVEGKSTVTKVPEISYSEYAGGDTRDSGDDTGGDTGGDSGGDTGGDAGGDTGGDSGGDTSGDSGGDTGCDAGGGKGGAKVEAQSNN